MENKQREIKDFEGYIKMAGEEIKQWEKFRREAQIKLDKLNKEAK